MCLVRGRSNNAKGATSTSSKSPKEVLIGVRVGGDVLPFPGNDSELKDIIDA